MTQKQRMTTPPPLPLHPRSSFKVNWTSCYETGPPGQSSCASCASRRPFNDNSPLFRLFHWQQPSTRALPSTGLELLKTTAGLQLLRMTAYTQGAPDIAAWKVDLLLSVSRGPTSAQRGAGDFWGWGEETSLAFFGCGRMKTLDELADGGEHGTRDASRHGRHYGHAARLGPTATAATPAD